MPPPHVGARGRHRVRPLEPQVHDEAEGSSDLRQRLQARVLVGVLELGDLLLADSSELAERALRELCLVSRPTDLKSSGKPGSDGYPRDGDALGRGRIVDGPAGDLAIDEVSFEPPARPPARWPKKRPIRRRSRARLPGSRTAARARSFVVPRVHALGQLARLGPGIGLLVREGDRVVAPGLFEARARVGPTRVGLVQDEGRKLLRKQLESRPHARQA